MSESLGLSLWFDLSNIFIYALRCVAISLITLMVLKYNGMKISWPGLGLFYKKASVVPTVKGVPIFGNALQIIKYKWNVKDVPPETHTLQALMGFIHLFQHLDVGVHHYKIGSEHMYTFFTPDKVEKILRSNEILNKSSLYDYVIPWLGSGLITSKETQWRKHRKLLTPAFHFKILDEFQPMMSDKSQVLVSLLKEHIDDEFVDIEPFISYYTMDVICETAMGIDIDSQRKRNSSYVTALKRAGLLTFKRVVTPYLWNDTLFKLFPAGKEYYRCLSEINSFVTKVIDERITAISGSELVETYKNKEIIAKAAKNGRLTFLDMLVLQHLVESDSLSKEDIKDEVHTFMFAGQDTTEVAITWALFLLGNYPEAQDKLYNEIQQRFGSDKDGPITIEDLKEMPYLEAVVKESLRLYPSVPLIGRRATKDIVIDDILIPKGYTYGIAVPFLHRNAEIFPDPERFVPERFLPENSGGRHPYAYIPFSAGPRNCIGQRFALLEEKTAIANMVRNFRIKSLDQVDKIPVCPELVSRPGKQIKLKLDVRL